jgi:glycosyltransferase involved in cell wall biosynthesis
VRIALVCDWYAPRRGGIETHLEGLGRRLAEAGHEVHVVTSTPGDAPKYPGLTIHRLGEPLVPGADVVFRPNAVRKIGAILTAERIEVAHCHVSIVSPVALGGAAAAERLGIPTVITFHSFVAGMRALTWTAGRTLGAAKWKVSLTAVSGRVAREVEPFAGRKVEILPNAIDTTFWTPSPRRGENERCRFIYVGRLQAKKRPDLIVTAARELQRKGIAAEITVVGAGPLAAGLRARAERARLANVRFIDWAGPAELRELLRESDVFLSPAFRESFGIAALEARAVGLPVVAMADSAVADFIAHEESGLLAADGSEFVSAAARLATDADLRRRMRDHNSRTPVPFSWERSVDAHLRQYERAIHASV